MKVFKLFLAVILVLSVVGWASAQDYEQKFYSYKQKFPQEKQCTVTNDRDNVWVRIVEVDRAGNAMNDGWPIYSGTMYDGTELDIKTTYGVVNIHYQRQNADRGYGVFGIKCDNSNTIRVP